MRYTTLLRRGDVEGADRALAMFARIAREMRVREWLWHHDRLKAQRAFAAGRLEEAERQFTELWAQSQRLQLPYGPMLYATQLNALSVERTGMRLSAGGTNDYDDGWSWARDIAIYRAQRILLWIQFGDLERARESLAALAENKCAGVMRDSNFLFTTSRLAQAAVTLDMRDAATELYAALQPYAGLYAISDFVFSLGSVSHFLGLLAKLLEQRTEARQHFERAIEANLATGHNLFALRARVGLADLLSTGRSRGERAEALTLVNDVREEAQRSGLNALRAEAQFTADRLASTSSRLTRVEHDDKAARNKRMRLR
jgi:hypothetical protein